MRTLISGVVLIFVLPRAALQCLIAMYKQRKIHLHRHEYVGRGMQRIMLRTVMINNRPIVDFDVWLHCFKGDLNLIGPARVGFKQAWSLDRWERRRFNVAPGLITPYQIKQASGIAHKTESAISVEFAANGTGIRRCQLMAIWLVQKIVKAERHSHNRPSKFSLFGVTLANVSMADAVDFVMKSLKGKDVDGGISKFAFVNADCVNQLHHDNGYREILSRFDAVFPDGVGIKIASRIHGYDLTENINGTDMFPLLCERLQAEGKSIYLHGASKAVVSKLVKNLQDDYPQLKIGGFSDGYSYANKADELHTLINNSNADLLLVAMGAPRQEAWINKHVGCLNVKAVMGVGGLFDFYSGEVSRAPEWLRELSLEWVWRLIQQPRDKAQRYLIGNPIFLFRALRASLAKNRRLAGSAS